MDAASRCYLNSILIRRDSFLSTADNLPDDYDRAALRALPISAPALLGPQVSVNVENWDKKKFDSSVRSIISKAGKDRRSPRKRSFRTDSQPPSKSRRFDSSASQHPSSRGGAGRGKTKSFSSRGKPTPKSAHPQ